MPSQYATGSVHVFLNGYKNSPAPTYFGTCERMPEDARQPAYEMLMNDISGTQKPLDVSFQGADAQTSLVMTRWNENLALSLEAKPGPLNTPGQWLASDVGTLMGLEGFARTMWLVNMFGNALAAKSAYTQNPSGTLFSGRRYLQCVIWAPEREEKGTAQMKRHFLVYSWPKLVTSQTPAGGTGAVFKPAVSGSPTFVLYDFDMTGITPSMIT